MPKKVHIMLTAYRDGFQSVYGARVLSKDFLPAVEAMADAGIRHFEAGGGARFQSLFFYCNENAFDMMDAFRQAAGKDADLQTLARGVSVVALDSQPRDVIDAHAKLFKKHGMTTIRNFDALNDVSNLEYSSKAIVDAGLKNEVCVTMMSLPPGCVGAHDPDFYEKTLKKIIKSEVPFHSVCFKDASGTSRPSIVFETIRRARKILPETTKISFHTHDTAGCAVICYQAAIEAGANQIDLAVAPVSGGTSQPDIATMWHALRDTDWKLDIDIEKVMEAERVSKDCLAEYFVPPEALAVEPLIPWSPMPGGALTANTQMMRDNGLLDRYPEVIDAMSEVVKLGGFGTSVTPVSQFYFQQAFNNVIFGKWKKIADGYGRMVLGYFGKTPVQPAPEVVKAASEQLKMPVAQRHSLELDAENEKKGLEYAGKRLQENGLEDTEENRFIVAACEDKGIAFLQGEGKVMVRKNVDEAEVKAGSVGSGKLNLEIDGEQFSTEVKDDVVEINGKAISYKILAEGESAGSGKQSSSSAGEAIVAPAPGNVNRILKQVGQRVKSGEAVMVIEALKMEMEINASTDGVVKVINVAAGDTITAGQELAIIA